MDRHYYRFVGVHWRTIDDDCIVPTPGFIFKCLTEEQARRKLVNCGEVWEKVEGIKDEHKH